MNILRLIGQKGLLGPDAPVRHPAKRRRLKTVIQQLIYRAGRLISTGRAYFSDHGRPFQPDRGRRNGAVGDALGERTSSVLNVAQSSTIRLKRAVVNA